MANNICCFPQRPRSPTQTLPKLKMNGSSRSSMSISRRESVRRTISDLSRRSLSFRTSQRNGDEVHHTTENKTLLQGFEWYTPSTPSYSHWKRLSSLLPKLRAVGISMIWLPPGAKAAHADSTGYDLYDLWDLGEFDQKSGKRTRWGSKQELVELCDTAKKVGISVMWDAVLNHKAGADDTDDVLAVKCDAQAAHEIQAWTRFTFPGRGEMYSAKKWDSADFTGTDYDANTSKPGVYKFRQWATDVDRERGNYDYLMFADIDHKNPSAREDLLRWSTWITTTLGLGGMRLDAMKHYSTAFQVELVKHLQEQFGRDYFVVGEYWTWNALTLSNIIGKFSGRISLFDVQLVYNFSDYSKERKKSDTPVHGDLRRIFEGSLLQMHPKKSVTFVANHDTQETQSLEAVVESWFVPHAYALILLRQEGLPCVFYGDVFGIEGPKPRTVAAGGKIPRLISARQKYAYGKQKDYFNEIDCIGWTRYGVPSKSDGAGLAVLVNCSWEIRQKKMAVGVAHRGETWTDLMGWAYGGVIIDDAGVGVFPVAARSISVWTAKGAKGRDQIDKLEWNEDLDDEL